MTSRSGIVARLFTLKRLRPRMPAAMALFRLIDYAGQQPEFPEIDSLTAELRQPSERRAGSQATGRNSRIDCRSGILTSPSDWSRPYSDFEASGFGGGTLSSVCGPSRSGLLLLMTWLWLGAHRGAMARTLGKTELGGKLEVRLRVRLRAPSPASVIRAGVSWPCGGSYRVPG
jgi:hypothetical protein